MELIPNDAVTYSSGPSPEEWEAHRQTIQKLYLENREPLRQIIETMKQQYSFNATIKMYKTYFARWGIDNKNLKRNTVKHIAHGIVHREKLGKRSKIRHKGREVDVEQVLRYLKKRGHSSFEAFINAASPAKDQTHVQCYTPTSMNEDESPQPDSEDVDSFSKDHLEDALVQRCLHTEVLDLNSDDFDSFNAPIIAPIAGIRYFVALKSVPLSPIPPAIFYDMERLTWSLKIYISGSLDSGAWCTGQIGYLETNSSNASISDNYISLMQNYETIYNSGLRLLEVQDFVNASQALTHALRLIPELLLMEHPHLIADLMRMHLRSHNFELHRPLVSKVFLQHMNATAAKSLGVMHPLNHIAKSLLDLVMMMTHAREVGLQCFDEIMQQRLGPWDRTALYIRRQRLYVSLSSANTQLAAQMLADYDYHFGRGGPDWKFLKIDLATMQYHLGAFREAGTTLTDMVSADTIAGARATNDEDLLEVIVEAFYILSVTLQKQGNMDDANDAMRKSVELCAAQWGWKDPGTRERVIIYGEWLMNMGKLEEADAFIQAHSSHGFWSEEDTRTSTDDAELEEIHDPHDFPGFPEISDPSAREE